MMGWLVLLCRLVLGGVFIYASLDKMAHPSAFAQTVHYYRLLPLDTLHAFSHLLPVLEFVAGSALVLGLYRRGAALVTGGLSLVFMVAIVAALARNLDISCGCFHTDGGHGVGLDLLLRDAFLVLLSIPPLVARDGGPGLGMLRRN